MRSMWPGRPTSLALSGCAPDAPPQAAATAGAAVPEVMEQVSRVGVMLGSDPSADPSAPFLASGQFVAAASWTRAITESGRIPNIDLFASPWNADQCRRRFGPTRPPGIQQTEAAVTVFANAEAPMRVRTFAYDAMHVPMGIDFGRLTYLRSRFSRRTFPVTCSQHGISYAFDLHPCFVSLLTAQIRSCDAIVCLTSASQRAMRSRMDLVAEQYSRAWGRPAPLMPRLELIPWGIDTDRFSPRPQRAARRDLELPPDRPVVLCLGRLRVHDKMDLTPLLLAFQRVRESARGRPLLALAGASTPATRERLLDYIKGLGLEEDVRTFFDLPPACLPSLYAACDVFTSPADSPSESFGLTILEAMACGKPVVASDWNGYRDLVAHGETGFLVRTDWADCLQTLNELAPTLVWEQEHLHVGQSVSVDVASMATYLAQLVNNHQLRAEMGRRGRARAEALYDWDVVVKQWVETWAELARIGRSEPTPTADRLDYLQPNYFRHFSHYASRIVDDGVCVLMTQRGKDLLAGRGSLLLHPWAQGFLNPAHLHAALSALKSAGWVGKRVTFGELLGALQRLRGLGRDEAAMHVMWLAKYDLVTLAESDSLPP